MSDVVIHIQRLPASQAVVCRVDAPSFRDVSSETVELSEPPTSDPLGPTPVRTGGESIAAWISQNADIPRTLAQIEAAAEGAPTSLHFKLSDGSSRAIAWESLYIDKFWALDARPSIARLPRGQIPESNPVRVFTLPLRVTCVLSAAGLTSEVQWEKIRAAARDAAESGLPIALTVIIGETAVREAAELAATADPTIQVFKVPSMGETPSLIELVERSAPHILHVFAHGDIQNGESHILRVATVSDIRGETDGSVVIAADELGEVAARSRTWLVVLNTCRGADSESIALTHAEQIVNKGVPAAIAMRTEIDLTDADIFTAAWYPELFTRLSAMAEAPASTFALPLAETLLNARRKLRDLHGGNPQTDVRWTVPVLYKLPGEFTLQRSIDGEAATQASISGRGTLEGLVAVLPEGTPAHVVEGLERAILEGGEHADP